MATRCFMSSFLRAESFFLIFVFKIDTILQEFKSVVVNDLIFCATKLDSTRLHAYKVLKTKTAWTHISLVNGIHVVYNFY